MAERDAILAAMRDAEGKAWEALSGYKFWMFGYHAARWVNYNSLLPAGTRFASPFRALVKRAAEEVERQQDALPHVEIGSQVQLLLGSEGDGA